MPPFKMFHQEDDEDHTDREVVGSRDLRESFKEQDRLRGSFFVNGVHFHQFETNGIDNLLALINAKSSQTGVKASIDDNYHLVLTGHGPAIIRIKQGAAYQEAPPTGQSTADEVVAKLKAEQAAKDGETPKNRILELLGLDETEDENAAVGAGAGGDPPPGPSADERKEAAEKAQEAKALGVQTDPPLAAAVAGQTTETPHNPSAPISGAEGGKTVDGTDRTGQGAGYSQKPDGTPPVANTPAGEAQRAAPPPEGAPHAPAPIST